jgi:hypothetical protein
MKQRIKQYIATRDRNGDCAIWDIADRNLLYFDKEDGDVWNASTGFTIHDDKDGCGEAKDFLGGSYHGIKPGGKAVIRVTRKIEVVK